MLVLSRKPGEQIVLGSDVVITVVQIAPGKVRIGIEAPKETPVVRTELLERDAERKPSCD